MTEIICKLRTPQDDRFSASGIVTIKYLANESEKMILSDAREIARNGQRIFDELAQEGIVAGQIPDGCFIPEGFDVTVKFAEKLQTVK